MTLILLDHHRQIHKSNIIVVRDLCELIISHDVSVTRSTYLYELFNYAAKSTQKKKKNKPKFASITIGCQTKKKKKVTTI